MMTFRELWHEYAAWSFRLASRPQQVLTVPVIVGITALMLTFGIIVWTATYQECRANGGSMRHCATLLMRLG